MTRLPMKFDRRRFGGLTSAATLATVLLAACSRVGPEWVRDDANVFEELQAAAQAPALFGY